MDGQKDRAVAITEKKQQLTMQSGERRKNQQIFPAQGWTQMKIYIYIYILETFKINEHQSTLAD